MPWDLSFAIATGLSEADWAAEPAHVQRRIAEIRARYEVRQRIAALEASLEAAGDATHGIGGNNPPPPWEDERTKRGPLPVIWEPLDDLRHEGGTTNPDTSSIRRTAEAFGNSLRAGVAWSASTPRMSPVLM